MMTSKELLRLEYQVAECIMEASQPLEQYWQQQKKVDYKETADPVTKFDVSIENALRSALEALLPNAGYIVEEGQANEAAIYNWVIDPIDQTKNFVGQVPLFYVQVALVEHGVPILGVIYNPVTRQLFSASRGNGTRINGQKITPPVEVSLERAIVDVDFGDSSELSWKMQSIEGLAEQAFRLRITGGAYAVHLLTGGIHAFIVINEKTKPVDQLPRMIVMREAGFVFEERTFGKHKVMVAACQKLATEVFGALQLLA